jgi:CheY-like chemotaxis protein
LWIDDDPQMTTAGQVLMLAGICIDQALSGASGLERLRERHYDAVVIDLRLPDCSGLDILRQVKKRDPRTPTILLSGFATVPDVITAFRMGVEDVHEKPLFGDELVHAVQDVIWKGSDTASARRTMALVLGVADHLRTVHDSGIPCVGGSGRFCPILADVLMDGEVATVSFIVLCRGFRTIACRVEQREPLRVVIHALERSVQITTRRPDVNQALAGRCDLTSRGSGLTPCQPARMV